MPKEKPVLLNADNYAWRNLETGDIIDIMIDPTYVLTRVRYLATMGDGTVVVEWGGTKSKVVSTSGIQFLSESIPGILYIVNFKMIKLSKASQVKTVSDAEKAELEKERFEVIKKRQARDMALMLPPGMFQAPPPEEEHE